MPLHLSEYTVELIKVLCIPMDRDRQRQTETGREGERAAYLDVRSGL